MGEMKVGDQVVVRHNPHDGLAGEDVLGVVAEYKAGAGFAGCDLAYVCYEVGGEARTLPFGTGNLEAMTAESAEGLAETYERRAAWLRRTAAQLRGTEDEAFVGVDWGPSAKRLGRVEMSRREVLMNADLLSVDVHDGGEGETAMERAAWRCCLRHGLQKLAREIKGAGQ